MENCEYNAQQALAETEQRLIEVEQERDRYKAKLSVVVSELNGLLQKKGQSDEECSILRYGLCLIRDACSGETRRRAVATLARARRHGNQQPRAASVDGEPPKPVN